MNRLESMLASTLAPDAGLPDVPAWLPGVPAGLARGDGPGPGDDDDDDDDEAGDGGSIDPDLDEGCEDEDEDEDDEEPLRCALPGRSGRDPRLR